MLVPALLIFVFPLFGTAPRGPAEKQTANGNLHHGVFYSLPGSPEAVPIVLGCGWAEVSGCPLSWQYSLASGCFMVKCYRYRMNYGALTNVACRFCRPDS